MRRIHRTFVERLRALAAYECVACGELLFTPRQFHLHLGNQVRCPSCGRFDVTKLKERDRIDRMHTGLLNLLEKFCGGNLYHCFICRLQFYDRRTLARRVATSENAPESRPTSPFGRIFLIRP